jgi:CDP-glycerol glycerophosphotransferase
MNAVSTQIILFNVLAAVKRNLTAIMAWIIGFPISLLIRRDPGLTVVIGRPGSGFADNSKYFFIYAAESAGEDERFVLLTTDPAAQRLIAETGGESVFHPSLRSISLLLRCSKVVTDNMDWYYYGAYQLTRGAKLIQIWHGAPLKDIELDAYRRRLKEMPGWLRPLIRSQKAMVGRYPAYDVVASTSQWFIDKAFKSAFNAKSFTATGYPRNDILFGWPSPESTAYKLALINVDQKVMHTVESFRDLGYKTCLYAPTFRKGLDDPFKTAVNLERLSSFAKKNNLLVVLKLHPFMHEEYRINEYPNLLEYSPLSDVYPLMSITDLLITDYSSIFFDYLLLDRPVLFFPYDLEQYLKHDREMYFNYNEMTPGAKCLEYNELESALERIILNGCRDGYSDMRKRIRSLAHDHVDSQAHRRLIYDCLRKL